MSFRSKIFLPREGLGIIQSKRVKKFQPQRVWKKTEKYPYFQNSWLKYRELWVKFTDLFKNLA